MSEYDWEAIISNPGRAETWLNLQNYKNWRPGASRDIGLDTGRTFPRLRADTPHRSQGRHQGEEEESLSKARLYELLTNLADTDVLAAQTNAMFDSEPRRIQSLMVLDSEEPVAVGEYARFFSALDKLYTLLLSVRVSDYFIQRWIQDRRFDLLATHRLVIRSISKASPDSVVLDGLDSGLKVIGEALSVGDQVTKLRTSTAKVRQENAKADKDELEVEELKRKQRLEDATEWESEKILRAKKDAELRAIERRDQEDDLKLMEEQIRIDEAKQRLAEQRLKYQEAQVQLGFQRQQALIASMETIQKAIPILEKMPAEFKQLFLDKATENVQMIQSSPLQILEFKQLGPAPEKSHKASSKEP